MSRDPRLDTTCFVDRTDDPAVWTVTVWNRCEPPDERVYTQRATCDNDAAMAGMQRFVDEMGAIDAAGR